VKDRSDAGERHLQAAGPNSTRAGLIKNLRAVTIYTANGLLPVPVTFANAVTPAFQPLALFAYGNCEWVVKVEVRNSYLVFEANLWELLNSQQPATGA
jgi:hypothetical protein